MSTGNSSVVTRSREFVSRIHAWALEQRPLPQSGLGKALADMGGLWVPRSWELTHERGSGLLECPPEWDLLQIERRHDLCTFLGPVVSRDCGHRDSPRCGR